jgi:DNA polymerase
VFDLSQIEARMVAWLAGQRDVLDVFARGDDVYVWTASLIGLPSRQAGKMARLALGFQMGAPKLVATAKKDYGLALSLAEAERFVQGFRDASPRIVELWWAADRAARNALAGFKGSGGRPVTVAINQKLSVTASMSRTGRTLMTLKLPSGRRLYYRNAALEPDPTSSIPGRLAITYDGVDPRTKRWTRARAYGGKLIENATQAAARDVIVEAALRIDEKGLGDLVMSAHDELVEEADMDRAEANVALIEQEIVKRPLWGLDLPVACEGGIRVRYGK